MPKPTILIFYANSPNQVHLNQLAEEGKKIQLLLNNVSGREYEVTLNPCSKVEDIIDQLNVDNREVEIIHYAGHSNGESISFEDIVIEAGSLATKLKNHKTKLVFINGCSSKGQVKFFQDGGIPYVIATSRPIEDEKATWVATQFYLYLTLRKSIKEALDEVVKDSQLLKKGIDLSVHRGLGHTDRLETNLAWGLYPLDDQPDYLLAIHALQQASANEVKHSAFLQNIIRSLKNNNSPIDQNYQKTIKTLDGIGGVSDKTILKDLLKILPYPLGIRLQQINGKPLTEDSISDYYRELLYDYTFFFETLLHYTTSIILCQIWQRNPEQGNNEKYKLLREFVTANRLSQSFEEYKTVIVTGIELLGELGFTDGLATNNLIPNYLKSQSFQDASIFFNAHKSYYWNKVRLPSEIVIPQCYEAQKFLSECFKYFSYVIENNLTAVREIKVMNYRYIQTQFANSIAQLVGADGTPDSQMEEEPMENKSILYFAESQFSNTTKSLNLFPFLLDRNVFTQQTATEVDLYLFIGFCEDVMLNALSVTKQSTPCYYFVSLKNPGKIWRFDETDLSNADLSHIDEKKEEQHRQNHLLTNAGELKTYLAEFKKFFLTT